MDLTLKGVGENGSGSREHEERRRSRRRPLPGIYVAIEAPEVSEEQCWTGSGMDINGDGLGLLLPAEVEPGAQVLLTFRLDGDRTFRRVPSVVVRKEADLAEGFGAVRFEPWRDRERLDLVSYLVGE